MVRSRKVLPAAGKEPRGKNRRKTNGTNKTREEKKRMGKRGLRGRGIQDMSENIGYIYNMYVIVPRKNKHNRNFVILRWKTPGFPGVKLIFLLFVHAAVLTVPDILYREPVTVRSADLTRVYVRHPKREDRLSLVFIVL